MPSISKKKWLLISIGTFLLILMICLSFYFFISKSDADMQNIPQIYYYDNLRTQVITRSTITAKQLHDYFRQAFFQYLPLLIAMICFCILLFSFIILYGVRMLDKKHSKEIADDLMQVSYDRIDLVKANDLKAEYQILHQKMTAFEEDQKRLHAYISHEQKNLIMLLKARIQSNDPQITRDIDKLSQSIDDILALSAHQDMQKTICDLAMIAAEQCDRYRSIYPSLSFQFDEEADYSILGKEQWLRRALDNLLENAVKYGDQKPIEVSLRQAYNSVLLYVQDHGKGMSEAQQERIFDYGYRIHTLKKDGYGIGLSLVCHVCELCDGFIHVKSYPDQGSTFILAFPLADHRQNIT